MGAPDHRGVGSQLTRTLPAEQWQPATDSVPSAPGGLELIVGINNLVSIAWLDRGLTVSSPVARVLVRGSEDETGTGFLVGDDLLLTNNHVLPDEKTALASSVQFNYQLSWSGQLAMSKRYAVTRFERTSAVLDYSLVRLDGGPSEIFGFIDPSDHADVEVGDFVLIVQHPRGGPKQIGLMDNKVATVHDNLLQYTTDTEPGSSGSPIFNTRWQIVGLHHAGRQLTTPDGKEYFANEGIRFPSLVADGGGLLGEPELLYGLALGQLRSELLKFVQIGVSGNDVGRLAMRLLGSNPALADAIANRLAKRPPTQDAARAVAASGAALGAALVQWMRSGSTGESATIADIPPGPGPHLVQLLTTVVASDAAPGAIYTNGVTAIEAKPLAVDHLVVAAADPLEVGAAVKILLVALAAGARAVSP